MNIKPLNGTVIIKPSKAEEVTKSGIIIPDTASKDVPKQGKIIAIAKTNISSTGTEMPIEAKKGDIILYPAYVGEDIKIEGEEYKILDITSIRAIVEDE